MNTYLLTYEDAKAISKRYNEKHFWEIQFMIGGYKLSSFNYFICGWDDFAFPLPEKPLTNAFDMRGTTFVFNSDGSLYKRFLMLPKFFNLNQVEATQYGNVKDKKIVNVSVKEEKGQTVMLREGSSVEEVVRALTSIGATPRDVIAILQAIKAQGALQAELEII